MRQLIVYGIFTNIFNVNFYLAKALSIGHNTELIVDEVNLVANMGFKQHLLNQIAFH